ncbi:MAG: nucleotidyltransferase domain-containing protein [Usitatibacter sp.]
MFSKPLDSSAQAAYAQLLDVARHEELSRSIENLSGSFNKKTVQGATYWYYQYTDVSTSKVRQLFVGPDSDPKVRELERRSRARDRGQVERLAKAAIALGCSSATPVHFRIIRRLNEVGFFGAGGLLIGTHAFLVYGNALGVSWEDLARTQDLDFAHAGNRIELALPGTLKVQTKSVIESLEAGFLPTPGFRPWEKTATFVSKSDKTLKVDFLAPMVRGQEEVYEHEQLGVNLQPLRFMEFLLEDVSQAAAVSSLGACVVTVPDPARFAFHKILVHIERRNRSPEKAAKDLKQAAALIEVIGADQMDRLRRLWKNIYARGPGWRSRAKKGIVALDGIAPALPALKMMRAI